MRDLAIRVNHLSKRYRIGSQRQSYQTLRESLSTTIINPFRRSISSNNGSRGSVSIWALRDISFEVRRGEVLGVIGSNGAGKSTLLKVLSRITPPTSGDVRLYGRVGSLLEVGTGFHPELTGRENIYLNGAVLGMRRSEIQKKFDEIVDFADIEPFLDTPVKRYSSGMYMRLAFSVSAHMETEILMVDEVLAVGDIAFQKKCIGKMEQVAGGGRTVLFVSHNLGAINKLCTNSLLLDGGHLIAYDESTKITQMYSEKVTNGITSVRFDSKINCRAQFLGVRILNDQGRETSDYVVGQCPIIEVEFCINEKISGCHVACIVSTIEGVHLFSTADTDNAPQLFGDRSEGIYTAQVQLPINNLNVGTYSVAVGIGKPGYEIIDRQEALTFTILDRGSFSTMKEGHYRKGILLADTTWRYLNENALT